MPSASEVQAKVNKLATNMDRLDRIINGAVGEVVYTDSVAVPTVADLVRQVSGIAVAGDPNARAGKFAVFGADNKTLVPSAGTGADSGLRTDLAATMGSALIAFAQGANYGVGSIGAKLANIISVTDEPFNAKGDGTTDDAPAFAAALAACPAGGTIHVPAPTSAYYLGSNPDPATYSTVNGVGHNKRAKYVHWDIAAGANFTGPGVGLPDSQIKFLSQINNPYNQTFGPYRQYDLTKRQTLNGGCLVAESYELAEDLGYAFTLTGNITNGNATITNPNTNLKGMIARGDRIEGTAAGWPSGTYMRVWDIASDGTITFGLDAGAGPAGPTNWTGTTQTGVSFTVVKKAWYALQFFAITTGGPNSRDMAFGIANDVVNITGGPANAREIDMIALVDPGNFSRAIFGTGHGDAAMTLTFMDIQRAGKTAWSAGIAMRHCTVGLFANAKNPLSIDGTYLNPATGVGEPINFGLHINNAPAILGAIVEGRQITNGAPGIAIWRNDDTSPSGDFLSLFEAYSGKKIAYVDVLGGAHFTTLQLDQIPVAVSNASITGYMTVKGNDGKFYKVATLGAV